jgi:hypothetical protein
MAGVAEQHHPAAPPRRQRIALEDAPLVHLGRGRQHGAHVGMKVRKGRAQFSDVAFRRPRFLRDPIRPLGLAGDEIDLVACRGDEIDHDMAVGAPPFGARQADIDAREARRRKGCAIGDAAGEMRAVGDADMLAHQRVHAIGTDHRVGDNLAAVREGERHPGAVRRDAHELLALVHAVGRYDIGERRMQVAAMEREIGRAVALLDRAAERMLVGDRARHRVAVERGDRRERHVAQPRLDAEAAMHLHGVRALLDAGADARECFRLLIDLGLDADAAQRRRGRKAADAGADDGDPHVARMSHRGA